VRDESPGRFAGIQPAALETAPIPRGVVRTRINRNGVPSGAPLLLPRSMARRRSARSGKNPVDCEGSV
jgi:hypothetical protein